MIGRGGERSGKQSRGEEEMGEDQGRGRRMEWLEGRGKEGIGEKDIGSEGAKNAVRNVEEMH